VDSVVLTRLLQVEDIRRALAGAKVGEPVRHRLGRHQRRVLRRFPEGQTPGKARADSGRVSAAGPVRGTRLRTVDRDLDVFPTVEQVVDGLTVAPGDDHGRSPEGVDSFRQLELSNSLLLAKNG
jgi:hypothetical protein